MKQGEQRHDTLFKETFSKPENARVELRVLLPSSLCAVIDWDSLVLEESELRIEGKKQVRCDMLYGLKTTSGSALSIYVLLEHQSAPDPTMPQRLLGYMCAKYAELATQAVALPWPVIIPAVVHHSRTGWKLATNYQSLFDPAVLSIPGVRALVPEFQFLLDDVSRASDAELLARAETLAEKAVPLALWALRDGADEASVLARFPYWMEVFGELWALEEARHILAATFQYLASLGLTLQDIEEASAEVSSEAKEAIMTLAEQLEDRGEQRGLAKGRVEGRVEGARSVLLKQLALKFTAVSPELEERIAHGSEADLGQWSERILSASSLDEVFHH